MLPYDSTEGEIMGKIRVDYGSYTEEYEYPNEKESELIHKLQVIQASPNDSLPVLADKIGLTKQDLLDVCDDDNEREEILKEYKRHEN